MTRRLARFFIVAIALGALSAITVLAVKACPFCSAVQLTLAQEMKGADAVVVAELTELPPRSAGADSAFPPGIGEPLSKSKFRIVEVLKGANLLKNTKRIETIYLGDAPVGGQFLITAVDPKSLSWATPIPLTKHSRPYIDVLLTLPETGPDRLAFFQDYLEDGEEMLKRDAYDEFAQASYPDVKAFGPRVNYEQLIKWLNTPDISPSHRRLYFTLLGVCGTEKDLPLIEDILNSKDRKLKAGLDAMIGSYLAIKGPSGLHLVEDLYLKNQAAEFTDTYGAIQAIRIAQETGIVNKDKAAEAFHFMLDRPKMADLVIPDLARWQDWSVLNQLVNLFVNADADSAWVRVPVLKYLQVCPLPAAKEQLTKLSQLDPTAAKQAQSFLLPGGAALPPASAPPSNAVPAANAGAAPSSTNVTNSSSSSTSNGSVKKN
jgi:hypothetical protein